MCGIWEYCIILRMDSRDKCPRACRQLTFCSRVGELGNLQANIDWKSYVPPAPMTTYPQPQTLYTQRLKHYIPPGSNTTKSSSPQLSSPRPNRLLHSSQPLLSTTPSLVGRRIKRCKPMNQRLAPLFFPTKNGHKNDFQRKSGPFL